MALHSLITTSDGKRSLTVVLNDGQVTPITDEHPGFENILTALTDGSADSKIKGLLDPANAIYGKVSTLSERVRLVGGTLTFDGDPIDGPIADFIVNIVQTSDNTDSYQAWINFLEKLGTNPSEESKSHLFKFMTAHGITVTKDGDIVLYKGVNADGTSVHAGPGIVNGEAMNGHLPNEVGSTLEIPRSKVDTNRGVACSTGLHAGTHRYASSFAPRLLTVVINPRDVVSVPSDSNDEKVRVSRYTVLEIAPTVAYAEPVLGAEDDNDWDEYDEYFGEYDSYDFDEDDFDEDESDEDDEPETDSDDFERRVANFTARIPSIFQDEKWDGTLALYVSKKVTAANRDAAREAIRRGGYR